MRVGVLTTDDPTHSTVQTFGCGRCMPRHSPIKGLDMSNTERHAPWENVYQTRGEREVSWFQENPAISLDLIRATGVTTTRILTIGDPGLAREIRRKPPKIGKKGLRDAAK